MVKIQLALDRKLDDDNGEESDENSALKLDHKSKEFEYPDIKI